MCSPLAGTGTELAGLPATLILTAAADVLRDEGEAYGAKLLQAGVNCSTIRVNGVTHDFPLLNAIASAAPVRLAPQLAGNFLNTVLA